MFLLCFLDSQDYTELPIEQSQDYTKLPIEQSQDYTKLPIEQSQDYTELPIEQSQDDTEFSMGQSQDDTEFSMGQSQDDTELSMGQSQDDTGFSLEKYDMVQLNIGAKRRHCTFNTSLHVKYPFLASVGNGKLKCKKCFGIFSVQYEGNQAIWRHIKSKKHMATLDTSSQSQTLTKFSVYYGSKIGS